MPDQPTEPRPPAVRVVAVLAGAVTAAWFFVLSGLLGATPTQPTGQRINVYFQSDAARHIDAAVTDEVLCGETFHPLLHPLFSSPVHRLTRLMADIVEPRTTAVYAARGYVASVAGLGVGLLAAAFVRFGVRPAMVAVFAPAFLLGTAQTLAALPEHFGLSLGVLAWSYAVFLYGRDAGGRATDAKLLALTILAGGLSVTNAAFPLLLLACRVATRVRIPRWLYALAGVTAVFSIAAVPVAFRAFPDDPFVERAGLYFNWRWTGDPLGAAQRVFRGPIDVAVGPTPVVDRNNYFEFEMLTYEPNTARYSAWPYDGVQAAAVVAWLALLLWAGVLATRDPDTRAVTVPLVGWVGWNLAFHNLWGDEFFLYAPHYSWAVAAAVLVGLRHRPAWQVVPFVAALAVGQVHTLVRIRAVLETLADWK